MKILFIFLQVITALPGNHPKQVNSIKDLPATVETLVSAIGSDNFQVPSAFLMTMDDLRTLNSQMKRPLSEEELKTRYERGLKSAHDRFRGLKEELGQTESMLSWDTLSYTGENAHVMDIKISFNTIDRLTRKITKNAVLIEFIVLGNRLLMDHSMRTISDLHYDLHVMEMVDAERNRELRHRYGPCVFDASETTAIPFQVKGKWGLVSLDGQVLVPAAYDSISKLTFNYYHVVAKKGHNLLDNTYRPVLNKPTKNISIGADKY